MSNEDFFGTVIGHGNKEVDTFEKAVMDNKKDTRQELQIMYEKQQKFMQVISSQCFK
jgi:hypothetical protein